MVEQDESKFVGHEIVRVRFLPRAPSKIQPLGFKTRSFLFSKPPLERRNNLWGRQEEAILQYQDNLIDRLCRYLLLEGQSEAL